MSSKKLPFKDSLRKKGHECHVLHQRKQVIRLLLTKYVVDQDLSSDQLYFLCPKHICLAFSLAWCDVLAPFIYVYIIWFTWAPYI